MSNTPIPRPELPTPEILRSFQPAIIFVILLLLIGVVMIASSGFTSAPMVRGILSPTPLASRVNSTESVTKPATQAATKVATKVATKAATQAATQVATKSK